MAVITFGDGGDYASLALAVAALPGTPTEDYELKAVSNTTNTSKVTLPATFNGKELYINGDGYTFTSNYNNEDIRVDATATYDLKVQYFHVIFATAKASLFHGFLFVDDYINF